MPRILVVDDEEQIRRILRMTLERAGHEVDTAADGNAAVATYDPARHDLVITDIVMPEKEGIETIQELHQVNADVKIIAISGGGRISPEEYLDWARRFGVHRTFTKPIDRDELLATIAELTGAPTA
ncbi:response regulator [bacterium]|nr:response regulator [bacterium]